MPHNLKINTTSNYRSWFQKQSLTLLDQIWHCIWWVWSTIIVGGFIVGILISIITRGTSDLANPSQWVILHLLFTHPVYTISGLIVIGFLTIIAYFAHHYQRSASQTRQLLHNESLVDIARGVRRAVEELNTRSTSNPLLDNETPQKPDKKGAFTSFWNVPYHRNPFFTGREEILNHLQNELIAGIPIALTQPQAITGLGGIGKTQTALEFAYRYQNNYSYIFWLRADSHDALISDIIHIAERLGLPEKDSQDQSITINAIKIWLEMNVNWLMILDNADDMIMIRDFFPTRSTGHIILTTRTQTMGGLAQSIEIEKMKQDEAALFLLRRAGIISKDADLENTSVRDRTIAGEISQIMDGLPLALDQAGAYIEETACSLLQYMKIYQERHSLLLKRRGNHTYSHPEPVAATWSLSFEKIKQNNPTAVQLLNFCAFLYPDSIPEEALAEYVSEINLTLDGCAIDTFELNNAIGELHKYSLVRRSSYNNTLTIHRLVQAIIKDGIDKELQYKWAERTVRVIASLLSGFWYTPWHLYQRYLPQVQVCLELIKQYRFSSLEAARLLCEAGYSLYFQASNSEAETLYLQSLSIYETILGLNHPDTAKLLTRLARLNYSQGRYAQAESIYLQALSIKRGTLKPDDSDTSAILNNLAKLFVTQGKYAQAKPLFLQALSINEKVLGPDHPYNISILNNLGILYRIDGDFTRAEQIYQQAITISEKSLSADDPEIASTLTNLTKLYRIQERYSEAEKICSRALAIREAVLGPDHPSTALTLNNLAMLHYAQHNYTLAESLYIRVIATFEKTKGPDHPEIATFLNNLAKLYYMQDKYDLAEPLYIRALSIREKNLGPGHLDTANILNNLALLYSNQGKHMQAEVLYQRAFIVRENVLGPEHPDTIAVLDNYANLLRKTGLNMTTEQLRDRVRQVRSVYNSNVGK